MTSSREERDLVESLPAGRQQLRGEAVDLRPVSKAVTEMGFYWMLLNQPTKVTRCLRT